MPTLSQRTLGKVIPAVTSTLPADAGRGQACGQARPQCKQVEGSARMPSRQKSRDANGAPKGRCGVCVYRGPSAYALAHSIPMLPESQGRAKFCRAYGAEEVVVQFESSHLTIAMEAWKPASLKAMPPQSNIM
jgi:hypothetical protein